MDILFSLSEISISMHFGGNDLYNHKHMPLIMRRRNAPVSDQYPVSDGWVEVRQPLTGYWSLTGTVLAP